MYSNNYLHSFVLLSSRDFLMCKGEYLSTSYVNNILPSTYIFFAKVFDYDFKK